MNLNKIKTDPREIWEEYSKGQRYNDSIELYKRVEKAENFFLGRQWIGVNAPDMDKPVFNVLKRVVNYFIAMLVSDNVGISLSLFNRKADGIARIHLNVFEDNIRQIMEFNDYGKLTREVLRDAAVDGDGCIHLYFDPAVETGRELEQGFVRAERIDNTSIFFGDVQNADPQKQPYIIIAQRRLMSEVREELIRQGRKTEAGQLTTDTPEFRMNADSAEYHDGKITVLTKYYRENGTIHFVRTTKEMTILPAVDMGLRSYPVCFMNWDRVKNSYHGVSVIDGLIPNQVAINKMAAMAQEFIKQQAFPRIFYNEHKLKRWVNGIKPIAVQGDPSGIVYRDNHNTSMSAQVSEYMSKFISTTRDLMGASDAALGNVSPDNTSAIIAVQNATAVPLQLVKQEYYSFTESFVRICLDMLRNYYGLRTVLAKDDNDEEQEILFDFGVLNEYVIKMKVDIGAAAYWSEITSSATLDNLYQSGLIDPVIYLESIPEHLIPNKGKIVAKAKEKEAEQPKEVTVLE